ncbi:hypothetical protein ACTWPT_09765 [Nonomuraea sp. 3N208]|uniref:hypothetical protein n=1 Tax=Nonomuraea sp. 3N208 TaxID=3457421 RepID=UPI003FCD0090
MLVVMLFDLHSSRLGPFLVGFIVVMPPPRRDRQCDRAKKPPKNTFVTKKRNQVTPPGSVKYKIKNKPKSPAASANALTRWRCSSKTLFLYE